MDKEDPMNDDENHQLIVHQPKDAINTFDLTASQFISGVANNQYKEPPSPQFKIPEKPMKL